MSETPKSGKIILSLRPNRAWGMGFTCFVRNLDLAGSYSVFHPADTAVHVSAPVTSRMITGSGLPADTSRHNLKKPASDSLKIAIRSKKALLLQARNDSILRQKMLQDLPVYASTKNLTGIPRLPVPANNHHQQAWIAGQRVNENFIYMKPHPLVEGIPDWTILFWIGSLGILLWARKSFARYFSQVIISLYDYTLSLNLFKDRNILLRRVSNLLQLNFMLVTALFIYLLWPFIPGTADRIPSHRVLLLACAIPPAVVFFRWLVNNGLGFLFSREKVFSEYNFQVQLNYKLLGIILLPLIILSLYFNLISTKTLLFAGIVIIISMYFHRLYRGYKIIVQHHVSIFYTILYLCTFEILPLILLFKLYGTNAG
jgi:hypothetical protein